MSKGITVFDVLNKMPENSTDLFWHQAGGKTLSKKSGGNAVIEVLVTNETFQDFAFQKTYGHSKTDHKERCFLFLAFDKNEYDKQLALLRKPKKWIK